MVLGKKTGKTLENPGFRKKTPGKKKETPGQVFLSNWSFKRVLVVALTSGLTSGSLMDFLGLLMFLICGF